MPETYIVATIEDDGTHYSQIFRVTHPAGFNTDQVLDQIRVDANAYLQSPDGELEEYRDDWNWGDLALNPDALTLPHGWRLEALDNSQIAIVDHDEHLYQS